MHVKQKSKANVYGDKDTYYTVHILFYSASEAEGRPSFDSYLLRAVRVNARYNLYIWFKLILFIGFGIFDSEHFHYLTYISML